MPDVVEIPHLVLTLAPRGTSPDNAANLITDKIVHFRQELNRFVDYQSYFKPYIFITLWHIPQCGRSND
jgi:hypothetical protein